jgi:hypothetical protein
MAGLPSVKLLVRMGTSDVRERVRHGPSAPRWAERLWIDPRDCVSVAPNLDHGRRRSGRVVGDEGDWRAEPIDSLEKLRMAEEHWRTGASWQDVGAYAYLMEHAFELEDRDGYRADDVLQRFRRLDALYEMARREGRLRPRNELPGPSFREHRGVYMHIDRDGAPLFGGGGCHRLAVARVLELTEIPVQLGAIHPDALDRLPALRSPVHG